MENVTTISDVPLYYRLMIVDSCDFEFWPTDDKIVEIYRMMIDYKVCAYFLNFRGCGGGLRYQCDGTCSNYGYKKYSENPSHQPFTKVYKERRRSV